MVNMIVNDIYNPHDFDIGLSFLAGHTRASNENRHPLIAFDLAIQNQLACILQAPQTEAMNMLVILEERVLEAQKHFMKMYGEGHG